MRVLAELGIADDLERAGQPSRDFRFKNHRGKVIGFAPTGGARPGVNVSRAHLHRLMRAAVDRHGIAIHYGKRLCDLSVEDGRVVARFDDGSSETGDFLVGADGVHSRVRAWMHPDHAQAARHAHDLAGRVLHAPGSRPTCPIEEHASLTFIVGPKHQFGYSKMAPTSGDGGVTSRSPTTPSARRSCRCRVADLASRMQERYRGWCAPTGELIARSQPWIRTPIHDVPDAAQLAPRPRGADRRRRARDEPGRRPGRVAGARGRDAAGAAGGGPRAAAGAIVRALRAAAPVTRRGDGRARLRE